MFYSPQSCTLPSQHTIVQVQAVQQSPVFCTLHRVFLPQDSQVWCLHLLQCHLASRIWCQVLLVRQGVKTPQSHLPHPRLLVSHLTCCVLQCSPTLLSPIHTLSYTGTALFMLGRLSCVFCSVHSSCASKVLGLRNVCLFASVPSG